METTLLAAVDVQGIVITIVIGLVAGALARFILPGKQTMNMLFTILLGVAGSFLGNFLAVSLNVGGGTLLWQIVFATAGAFLLLIVLSLFGVFKKKS